MKKDKIFENTMDRDFHDWLKQEDYSTPYIHLTDKASIIVIKVKKSDNFDYLFTQRNYTYTGMERNKNFEYAGLYFKQNGLVYDEQCNLDTLLYINHGTHKNNLSDQLKQNVHVKIESIINNDKSNLNSEVLHDTEEVKEFIKVYQPYAKEAARRYFLDKTFCFESLTFKCPYKPEDWTEDSLLSYIEDPETYVEQEVRDYINNHQKDMLDQFIYMELVQKEYKRLEKDKSNPVHIIKEIMHSINYRNMKTVKVTICKDGKEFSFRYYASELIRDCGCFGYSTSVMNKKDYKEFEVLFGKMSEFFPEDIVSIIHNRKILYPKP